jgi:hypothetical protein
MPETDALEFEMPTETLKNIGHRVLTKFHQKRLKQQVGQYVLGYTRLLIPRTSNNEELRQNS